MLALSNPTRTPHGIVSFPPYRDQICSEGIRLGARQWSSWLNWLSRRSLRALRKETYVDLVLHETLPGHKWEFSANTKPSEGLSRGADDSGVLGIKHGAMMATRKEIKWQEGLRARLRGTRLVTKLVSLLGRTCGYSLDVRDSTTIVQVAGE